MVSMTPISANLDKRRDAIEEALEEFVQLRMAGSEAPAMRLASDILLAEVRGIDPSSQSSPSRLLVVTTPLRS